MTYKFTLETDSLEEMFIAVSKLRDKTVPSALNAEPEPSLPEPMVKKGRKPGVKPIVEEAKQPIVAELVKDEAPVVKPQVKTAENVPTEKSKETSYGDVSKATLELIKAKGKPAAIEVLEQFKVRTALELKPEQYAEYVGAVNAKAARL